VNFVWSFLLIIAVIVASYNQSLGTLGLAMLDSAKSAAELALALLGSITLWLGLIKIIEAAGLVKKLAQMLAPLFSRLFPDIPKNHPAVGTMLLNLVANAFGLSHAATPFGLRAMQDLDRLSAEKGVATDAMALFLAINTSGVTLIPVTVIALRAAANSKTPGAVFLPMMLTALASFIWAILVTKLFARLPYFHRSQPRVILQTSANEQPSEMIECEPRGSQRTRIAAYSCGLLLAILLLRLMAIHFRNGENLLSLLQEFSNYLLPLVAAFFVWYGWLKGIAVYDVAVSGAKEGFDVVVRIIPYLVLMMAMLGLLRSSGVFTAVSTALGPVTQRLGLPAELLPQIFIRPFSGSAALGMMSDNLKTYGPDSKIGFLSSILYGSSETTFYVLAIYYGVIQVRRIRHTLVACLCADTLSVLSAIVIGRVFYAN